ncbi:M48 family metalloprotease [Cupriavidus basilensis]
MRDRSINARSRAGAGRLYRRAHGPAWCGPETESELASVLGHEIGHVMQRHTAAARHHGGGTGSDVDRAWPRRCRAGLAATRSPDAAAALAMGGEQGAAIANQVVVFARGRARGRPRRLPGS